MKKRKVSKQQSKEARQDDTIIEVELQLILLGPTPEFVLELDTRDETL